MNGSGRTIWTTRLSWLILLWGSCSDERPTLELPSQDECFGRADSVLCSSGWALRCEGGAVAVRQDCAAQGLSCANGLGCRTCEPRSTVCQGQTRSRCDDGGHTLQFVEECAAGLWCSPAGCRDLCADAIEDRSYLGCDYWPVFTSNSQLDSRFTPAVAIGNGNPFPAHVIITKGERTVAELDVAARSAATVELAFDPALKNAGGSRVVRQGAYHLRSNVPVTVHQFNPLLFELDGECQDPEPVEGDNHCYSYTNDASLLFPSTALQQEVELTGESRVRFIATSRASFMAVRDGVVRMTPGFVAVVAVGPQPVQVRLQVPAHTFASPESASEPVEALAPGSSIERTLAPGDVLQLLSANPPQCAVSLSGEFCDPGAAYDLTGTEISADGPIQVISGHDCSNVPFDRRACDHLEESMMPLHAWGTSAVASLPQMLAGSDYMLRVISGADGNLIAFDPPIHEPVTLGRGQLIEFRASASALVSGSARLMVAQYLMGQGGSAKVGDPSLTVAVPIDQYRASYNFLSPSTYPLNYVDIVARHDDVVTLDGELVDSFRPVGSSPFRVTTVRLEQAGAHEIRGSNVFGLGIALYGLGSYTSYMLPGGLDLQPIGIGI